MRGTGDESDWLGLRSRLILNGRLLEEHGPSFSKLFSEELELDPLGLSGYWAAGYSVFGSTPWSGLSISRNGTASGFGALEESSVFDDDKSRVKFAEMAPESEGKIFSRLRSLVNERLAISDSLIVLPLSGGLDSRLLLWALRDVPRGRIRAFTYGTSFPQQFSREVLTAKSLAAQEKVEWTFIPLGNVNAHAQKVWPAHRGFSHLHGMYHYEFYSEIRKLLGFDSAVVLSGSVGDAWAGSIARVEVGKPEDLSRLLLSHQLRGPWEAIPGGKENFSKLLQKEFDLNGKNYSDPVFNVVNVIRQKMSLLRYLHEIPESLGFEVFAPFHDQDLALGMLGLSPERRLKRKWQREFLSRQFPQVASNLGSTSNSLNFQFLMSGQVPLTLRGPGMQSFDGRYLSRVEKGLTLGVKLSRVNLSRAGGSIKSSLLLRSGELNPSLWSYIQSLLLYPFFEDPRALPVRGH